MSMLFAASHIGSPLAKPSYPYAECLSVSASICGAKGLVRNLLRMARHEAYLKLTVVSLMQFTLDLFSEILDSLIT